MKLEALRLEVSENPGSPRFVELARLLSSSSVLEAREVCFRGLTANPRDLRGRLELARLFYLDGYIGFAVAQLEQLKNAIPDMLSLDRLLSALGVCDLSVLRERSEFSKSDGTSSTGLPIHENVSVLAELDLEADIVDMYERVVADTCKCR